MGYTIEQKTLITRREESPPFAFAVREVKASGVQYRDTIMGNSILTSLVPWRANKRQRLYQQAYGRISMN